MKIFYIDVIFNSVILYIVCVILYVFIYMFVKCKWFNNVMKYIFNFYMINYFNGCVLGVLYQIYEEFELKKKCM